MLPVYYLSSKSAMNKLLQILPPDPARLQPLPGTQPLAIRVYFSAFTIMFLASCLYYACSVTSFFQCNSFSSYYTGSGVVYGRRD